MPDVTLMTQLMDYSLSIRDYIMLATGLPADRIIYSTPDLAKRRIRERRDRKLQNNPGHTSEINEWVSYFFAFGGPGIAFDRQSTLQGFKGGLTFVSKHYGWNIPIDIPIQIDIWGDKGQLAGDFVFNNRMGLNAYMYRNQRLYNSFTQSGFLVQDPDDARKLYDIPCWYNIIPGDTVDNGVLEDLFVAAETQRSTVDLMLQASFYQGIDPNAPPDVLPIHTIIVGYTDALGNEETEFIVSGTKTRFAALQASTATVVGDGTVSYLPEPIVTEAIFTGNYPGVQTDLKEDDTFDLSVTVDQDFVEVEFADYGTYKIGNTTFGAVLTKVVTGTIADRGDVQQFLSGKIRVKGANDKWSPWYDTATGGDTNGVNKLYLDNLHPTIDIDNTVYPLTQLALKDSEQATVNTTLTDYDSFIHTYPSGQLSEVSADANSVVVQRIAGDYNLTTGNVQISATRNENGATSVSLITVAIAHIACEATVTVPYTRLRSGGNEGTVAQDYEITLTTNQLLLTAPDLTAPSGTWQGAGFVGVSLIWTRDLQIHDNDSKGTKTWSAISAINLAGRITSVITGDDEYTIGGFLFRTITVAAWPNREATIGTQVSDVTKLECTNKSEGDAGSLNFTYKATIADLVDTYTIAQPTGVANPVGNLWYNCDLANAVSNSTGLISIELEELL